MTDAATARMDAARWLHRVAYHSWRIVYHLSTIEASREESVVHSAGRDEAIEDVRAD
jgi:phosphate:Na+ symporter